MMQKLLLVLLLAGLVQGGSVWPKPRNVTATGRLLHLVPGRFHFVTGGCQSSILDAALRRYEKTLCEAPVTPSPNPSFFPSLARLRHGIVRVRVDVASPDQSLGLDTNEEYELRVAAPVSSIKTQTVYGALRGLETWVQLVDTLCLHDAEWERLQGTLLEASSGGGQDEGPAASGPQPGCAGTCSCQGHGKHCRRVQVVEEQVVHDGPRFRHRGLLIDSARHFLPLPVIKQHLDAMEMSKMNVLHWHIVDDQSFPLESKALPRLTDGAFKEDLVYSAADVADVVEYARLRGIRVVPEVDTPGHTRSWGHGNPHLLTPCYSSQGQPTGELGPLNPARNDTYALLWQLLREVAAAFPDVHMHVGGDEVDMECWKSNPEVRQWVKEQGWGSDFTRAEDYFEAQVLRLASAAGKSCIVWEELFTDGAKLRNDTLVQVWKWWADAQPATGESPSLARRLLSSAWALTGRAQHALFGGVRQPWPEEWAEGVQSQPAWAATLQRVTSAGYRALLSAPWYLNLGSYAGEDWAAYYSVEPLAFSATPEHAALVLGGEACMWGEYVDATNAIPRTWPRAAAVAERLWSDASVRDVDDARRRLTEHRCGLLARGVQAQPLGPGFCPTE